MPAGSADACDASDRRTAERRTGPALSSAAVHACDPVGNRMLTVEDGVRTTFAYDAADQLASRSAPAGDVGNYMGDVLHALGNGQHHLMIGDPGDGSFPRRTTSLSEAGRLEGVPRVPAGVLEYSAERKVLLQQDGRAVPQEKQIHPAVVK